MAERSEYVALPFLCPKSVLLKSGGTNCRMSLITLRHYYLFLNLFYSKVAVTRREIRDSVQ